MSRDTYAGAVPELPQAQGPMASSGVGPLARALLDHLGWIVGATAVGAVLGAMVGLSAPNQYRAQVLVQAEGKDAALRGFNAGQAQPASQDGGFDQGVLTSRAVVGPVVERLRLDVEATPVRAPLIGPVVAHFATPGKPRGTWPESLGYAWGGERLVVENLAVPERLLDQPMLLEVMGNNRYRLSVNDNVLLEGVAGEQSAGAGVEINVARIEAAPGTRFVLVRHDLARTADHIAGQLVVDSDAVSATAGGTLRLSWKYGDPQLAAELVNGVANSYINGVTAQRRGDAAGSLAFLAGELPRVQAELQRAEEALARYRSRSGSLAPSRDAQSVLNSSMEFQRQIAALRLERTRLLQKFTTDSNEVKTVDSQIAQMVRERQETDARMQTLSAAERESVSLQRDVKVAEDMYMNLRAKVEQLSLVQSDRSQQVRIVDAAIPALNPVGPGSLPVTTGGALLGLGLSVAAVTLRRRLKPSVASASEAETQLGMMMLGDIAYCAEQADLHREIEIKRRAGIAAGFSPTPAKRLSAPEPGTELVEMPDGMDVDQADRMERHLRQGLHDHYLLARRLPHSRAVEGLRNVRAAMYFTIRHAPNGVVAVTSPAPGAGKTFAAVNLAVLFAEAGQRVLLIDADLRRGRVADWFDQPESPGLAEVLAGRTPLGLAARPTVVSGLHIITRGEVPPNPSELLMSPVLGESLRFAGDRFDLVIVDTPPVMAVADATLVAHLAGSTLLVLRAESTPPVHVDEALKRLARANARLLGGILNAVMPRRSNRSDFDNVNPYLGMPLPPEGQQRPALTGTKNVVVAEAKV